MINLEWNHRLEAWRKALPDLFFVPLDEVVFEGFTTFEHLTAEKALKQAFHPFPAGSHWGKKWEYAWFRARVKAPEAARGERLVLRSETGPESLIWVNGKELGSRSWAEREATLTHKAKAGEVFDILIESYAGGDPHVCGGGPCIDGWQMVPEPKIPQVTLKKSEIGIWDEEVYQLWLDVETLARLARSSADQESLRVAKIDDALKQVTLVVDLELPRREMLETVRRGRELLRPLLAARNGSTAPGMHCFGHGHLDVAWLWPLRETESKTGRTFSSQLTMMEEYPEYKFLQSEPHVYRMAKEYYPALYGRLRKAVKRGQWIADGGMWVEPDTNVPSGESLVRQFIHGKRFFKEEFGIDSRLTWLPDVFGYSGALPQIMKGCGMDGFSTQKIFWTYNGGDKFPYNWFWWEGIDGTRLLSYIHNEYTSQADPQAVLERWKERVQKDGFHQVRLMPFGYGDGGGGPVRNHVEFLRRQVDLEGSPRCRIEAPIVFFDEMLKNREALAQMPTWVGELYFQCHRGTYTTQAKTKKNNRLSERFLREAELWGVAARALEGRAFPLKEIDLLWKHVLLNQFHDILPGSSIHRVYEEAEALHGKVIKQADGVAEDSRKALVKAGKKSLTVFNSLSWKRGAWIELPEGWRGAADIEGNILSSQKLSDGKNVVRVPGIPSMGWTTLEKHDAVTSKESQVSVTTHSLENEFLRVEVNDRGELTRIFDKQSGREMAAGPCNAFRLYKDVPSQFDGWDLDSPYKQQPVELPEKAKISMGEKGSIVGSLRVKRTLHQSTLEQEIVLCADSRRIEFRTRIDWKENHKVLKVNFPVTVHAEDALHEIQFGHVRRPTHASQIYDASRFEVSQHKWSALAEEQRGAAILNDCKYGVSVEGNSINLTLLRSPLAPDMTADRGIQEFTYAFFCWNGVAFNDSGLIRDAYELNFPVEIANGAAGERSLFEVSASNVIIETVKPAEDGSKDIVLRLYESGRTATHALLTTSLPIKKAKLVNMLEEKPEALDWKDGGAALEFRPFEVKTIRLSV